MKTSTSDIVALMSILCFVSIKAVEVYTAGPDGKPSWTESSVMRDRSNVPTPSSEDMAEDYRRRSKISISTKYRTRSDIPVPIVSKYRTRSKIPVPIARNYRHRSDIPVPRTTYRRDNNVLHRRATHRRKSAVQKKNFIDRIFFTLPFGAQFPFYFTSPHSKKVGSRGKKKSDVALPIRRHRPPFRLQTWGLPVNYKAVQNRKFLTPYIQQQAIARQQIIPIQGGLTSFRSSRGSYNPRFFFKSQLLNNRNSVPYLVQRSRQYTVPRSRYFLNRITRSNNSISKKSKTKEEEEQNRAVINRDHQRMRMDNKLDNLNTSTEEEPSINNELEKILTQLIIMV